MSRTAKDVFLDALDIANPTEREVYVNVQTAGDAKLREDVRALLAAHAGSPTFSPPQVQPTIAASLSQRTARKEAGEGDIIDGRFTLIRPLGEGGFGIVWLARQTEPVQRDVALKLLRGIGLDSAHIVARFEAERQTLARMEHPSIARVFDAGATEAGVPYFVMEYVDGQPITRHCEEAGLSLTDRLALIRDVCLAVQHAHQKGVIHRDLKPGNILVTVVDGKPEPKVIDFGIAKAIADENDDFVQPSLTLEAQVIGTPQYMSPEQATIGPKNIDTRSDVYSLGTVTYELITGSPPFDPAELRRAGLEQICRIVRERTPSKPSTRITDDATLGDTSSTRTMSASRLRRQVVGEVDWIVMKALEKEPARRYQTAESLAADIGRFLNHEPIDAGPPSRLYALRKFVRRRRLEVATAAIVAVALVATTAISTYQKQQARRAQQSADEARAFAERAATGERDAKVAAQKSEQLAIRRADEAARELSKANAIADFAETMLSGLGAGVSQGRDTTLIKEMLEKATSKSDEQLKQFPEEDLILRGLIGHAQFDLGDYQKAIDTIKPRFDSTRDSAARDSFDRLSAGLLLGTLYQETDHYALAGEVFREIVDTYARLNDTASNTALQAQSGLASVLNREGKLDESLVVYRKTLDRLRELGRGESEPAMQAWNSLAATLRNMEKPAEAQHEWEALLAVETRVYGEAHPSSLATMSNLATTYADAGDDAKSLDLYRRVADGYRKIFEPNHPMRLPSLMNYTTGLIKAKRFDDAQSTLDEAMSIVKANASAVGWKNAAFVQNIATKLSTARGDKNAAVEHAKAMRDIYADAFPKGDYHAVCGEEIVLEALVDAARYDEAAVLVQTLGPNPWPKGSPKDYEMSYYGAVAQLHLARGMDANALVAIDHGKALADNVSGNLAVTRRLAAAIAATRPAAAVVPATAQSPVKP